MYQYVCIFVLIGSYCNFKCTYVTLFEGHNLKSFGDDSPVFAFKILANINGGRRLSIYTTHMFPEDVNVASR